MKKDIIKIVSAFLAAVMILCGASVGIYASSTLSTETNSETDSALDGIVSGSLASSASEAASSDTVYVITGTDGSVEKVFDNEYVTDSQIPVKISISYMLDGTPVSASELSGKSGNVTIRFDYENLSYETVVIGEKEEKIYVPFTMVSGVLLDDKRFSNVEISSGKLIDDGNRTIALGVAFPGLKENLDLEDYDYDLSIPDYVEITADVTDFSLDMTLSIATNEVFSGLENKDVDSIDDLKESLDKLNDAAAQLLDGSAKLYEGLDTLNTSMDDLVKGVNELNDGAKKLKDGAKELKNGASDLKNGVSDLSTGLNTLDSQSGVIRQGTAQLVNSVFETASAQLKASGYNYDLTIDNYASILDSIIASLDSNAVYNQAKGQVSAQVEANNDAIVAGVTAAVRAQVEPTVTATVREGVEAQVRAGVLEANGLTEESFDALDEDSKATINSTVSSMVDTKMQSDEVKAVISANVDAYISSEEGQALINQAVAAKKAELIDAGMNTSEVQNALNSAAGGVATLANLKTTLDGVVKYFNGVFAYTDGVSKVADGAGKLSTGAKSLSEGASSLYDGTKDLYKGTSTLSDKMPELSDGVSQLCDGAKELNEGFIKFNDEGISKINEFIHNDIETLIDKFHATVDASKNYKAAYGEDENSSIKFIFRSEAID